MATKLIKRVRREMLSGAHMVRGKHSGRNIIVSLMPGDELEFQVKGTRQKFTVYLGHCFRLAQMLTIEANYKQAMETYAQRRKITKGVRRPKKPMLPFGKLYFDATKNS